MKHITSSTDQRFPDRQEFEYQGERKREGKVERVWRHYCRIQGLVLLTEEAMNLRSKYKGCLMCERAPSSAAVRLSHNCS